METRHTRSSMALRQRYAGSRSSSMLVPYADRQLAVVPPAAAKSRRMIPRGWRVKEVIRSDGSRSDRYLIEPGSGRKFRSIREVHRYMNGEACRIKSRSVSVMAVPFKRGRGYRRMMVSGGKLLRADNEKSKNHLAVIREAPSILPDGWIVEEVPRSNVEYADKYYYDPESGQRFRSLIAIERYLAELDDNVPLSKTLEEIMENKPLARAFKLENHKSSTQRKKSVSPEKSQASSFLGPPMKVTWVLATAQGDSWNPFITEAMIPDSVKQQWTNRFTLIMKEDSTSNFQNSQA